MKFNLVKFLKKQRAYVFIAFIVGIFIFIFMTFRVREGQETQSANRPQAYNLVKNTLTLENIAKIQELDNTMTNENIENILRNDPTILIEDEANAIVGNNNGFTVARWNDYFEDVNTCRRCDKLTEIATTLQGFLNKGKELSQGAKYAMKHGDFGLASTGFNPTITVEVEPPLISHSPSG